MISRKDVNHGQTEEHETFVSLGFGAENYYDQQLDRDGEHAVCASAVVTKTASNP
jgi:hypothetical protein